MKLLSLSEADKRDARKMGKVRTKPKKPKASASLSVWENYGNRYNDWIRYVQDKAKSYRKKQTDKKKKTDLIKKIRGHS